MIVLSYFDKTTQKFIYIILQINLFKYFKYQFNIYNLIFVFLSYDKAV